MLKKINWPTASVAIAGIVLIGLVAFFGKDIGLTDEAHAKVLGALGTVEALVLALMKEALLKKAEPKKEEILEDGADDEKEEE